MANSSAVGIKNEFQFVVHSILNGDPASAFCDPQFLSSFLKQTYQHDLQPLLYHHLRHLPVWEKWPAQARETLAGEAMRQALIEEARRQELVKILDALSSQGVQPLLLKGAGLAYLYYSYPSLRPRCDTDLLIPKSDRLKVDRVLTGHGFIKDNMVSGERVNYQQIYFKKDTSGVDHIYDIHEKVSNPQLFAGLLPYEELILDALPVPSLGKFAKTLSPAHALLLSGIHRVAHHHDREHGIWLYDIYLLGKHMTLSEFKRFEALAKEKRVRAICARGLALAEQWFGTFIPEDSFRAPFAFEPTATFLEPHRTRFSIMISDLNALSALRDKIKLIQEWLFPPASYMLRKYSVSNPALLPFLYSLRILHGLGRLLTKLHS